MPSVVRERKKSGQARYRIQCYDQNRKRKSIRLASVNRKAADGICVKVERLLAASIAKTPVDAETSEWVTTIGDDLASKLADAGPITPRSSATLGPFIDRYIKKLQIADNTRRNLENSRDKLVDYFGQQHSMGDVTPGDADEWRHWLVEQHAEATMSTAVKHAKRFFKAAVRKKSILRNPFEDVKGGSYQNDERKEFISRETIQKVIDAAPDAEWRLIIALARYGGLRTPSEILHLQWTDIDWERDRFTVTAPKTKRHRPTRVVPLFPELRPYLEASFEMAEPGQNYVITRYRETNSNLRTQFLRIIKRASVQPWQKVFQNLRASCETELADRFPLKVVTDWLGNSPQVAERHYLQTIEKHFQEAVRAEEGGATVGAMVVQKSVPQHVAPFPEETNKPRRVPGLWKSCRMLRNDRVPPRGVEPLLPD